MQQLQQQQLQQGINPFMSPKFVPVPEMGSNGVRSTHGQVSLISPYSNAVQYNKIEVRERPTMTPISAMVQPRQTSSPASLYEPKGNSLYQNYEPVKSMRMVHTPTITSERHQETSSGKIDPRAELQNQINFILTNTPNLSEGSRQKHRDAIIKAVQSSFENVHSEFVPIKTESERPDSHMAVGRPQSFSSAALYQMRTEPERKMFAKQRAFPSAYESFRNSIASEENQQQMPPTIPQPLSYKSNMQQQIQQYLQEQINQEEKYTAPLGNLISNKLRQQVLQKVNSPYSDNMPQGNRFSMAPMLLNSPKDVESATVVSQATSSTSPVSFLLSQQRSQQENSESPQHRHQATEITAKTPSHIQPENVRSTREYSEWWKESPTSIPLAVYQT